MQRFYFSMRLFVVLFLGITYSVAALPANKQPIWAVQEWLELGPIRIPLPAFHDTPNLQGQKFETNNLLEFSLANTNNWWPVAGEILKWDHENTFVWQPIATVGDTLTFASQKAFKQPNVYYLAAYLQPGRFIQGKFKIASNTLFKAFLDGQSIAQKTTADTLYSKATSEVSSRQVNLETGKHLLLIRLIILPQLKPAVQLSVHFAASYSIRKSDLVLSTDPKEIMTVEHLLNGNRITRVTVSPDGEFVALSLKRALPPSDKSESWLEIRRLKDGRLVRTFRGGMKISQIEWAPVGQKFAYSSSEKGKSTLWIYDLQTETGRPLLQNIKHLGAFTWSPDGTFLIYSLSEKPKKNKTGLKRLLDLADRWPWWRTRSFLYRVNYPSGTRQRLTAGRLSTNLNSISPDGKQLLFTRTIPDYSERPYSKTQFFILHLNDLTCDSLWTVKWSGTAQWSPDGKYLLITGGPSMFGNLGVNLPKGVIPNDYDTQAYLYNLQTKKVEPITKTFKPAINQGFWGEHSDRIYFVTTDRSYRHLYEFRVKSKKFYLIATGADVIHSFSKAAHKPVAAALVSGASFPPKVVAIDLRKKQHRFLATSIDEQYRHIVFGKVKNFNFKNRQGRQIEGRIYYPPAFDPNKKYPAIVYYYGGTLPVGRDFGGRYPKELWAANGYVVYVLQPSGATGFGQAFSALHVNDWGKIVAQEIIDGAKKFLAAHPFVDSSRVGCIGASYGGFMTMTLVTKTNLFAAAVAHAGISSISSYWGQGYWGYLYSAIASANSFPWNRRDIYVDRSPLFHADNVTTPLLLLHGTSDTNVPPGESIQFYTSLKLLGRTVELVEIDGENHHILTYGKRKRWTKTILAWFDRWLKDQPQWWDALYGKP